jgi:hypothetical protein
MTRMGGRILKGSHGIAFVKLDLVIVAKNVDSNVNRGKLADSPAKGVTFTRGAN